MRTFRNTARAGTSSKTGASLGTTLGVPVLDLNKKVMGYLTAHLLGADLGLQDLRVLRSRNSGPGCRPRGAHDFLRASNPDYAFGS
jgi:hypothetical protein